MDYFEPLRSCEIFDPKTETWTAAAPLAEKRWFGAGAVLDGRAHVAGGRSTHSGGSRTMEIYDAAVELIRIRGRKNPSKFLNDPISVNPQTSQLLHPPASLPPDPRKMALQARVKADQLAVAV